MEAFFRSGAAADIVLLAMLAEAAWLIWSGRSAGAVAAAILPGALIVLAVRAALTDAGWWWVALSLTASLPLHLADLVGRGWLARARTRNLKGLISVKPDRAYQPRRGK